MRAIYFCQNRMVVEYHLSNGQILFSEPLASPVARWFKDFDKAEALETHNLPERDEPDLVYEGGKLSVVSDTLKADGPGRIVSERRD